MALHGLREVRGLCAVGGVVWALSALSGCATAQAKSSSDKLPLDIPPPPPHVVVLPAEPLEPVGDIPNASTTNPGASRVTPHPAAKSPEAKPEKPDNPPAATPAETPAPTLPPPAPAPQLQQTADTSAAAKNVRTTIEHARTTLNNVDFGHLSNERKKAYNDVKGYCQQAEDALKESNIVFAQAVATKAEKLALELAGR